MLLKTHSCQNNLERSYTEKKAKHEPSGWVILTKCSFDAIKNKLNYYKGIDCIKKFCKMLKNHAMETISHEEKEMIPLTDEEISPMKSKCHVTSEHVTYVKKKFCLDENDEDDENDENENDDCDEIDENENDVNDEVPKS